MHVIDPDFAGLLHTNDVAIGSENLLDSDVSEDHIASALDQQTKTDEDGAGAGFNNGLERRR